MRNEKIAANTTLEKAELLDKSRELMQRYTGTSASDCQVQMNLNADRCPGTALGEIAQILLMMNHHGIEKKAHRQALARAGRKALNKLSELSE